MLCCLLPISAPAPRHHLNSGLQHRSGSRQLPLAPCYFLAATFALVPSGSLYTWNLKSLAILSLFGSQFPTCTMRNLDDPVFKSFSSSKVLWIQFKFTECTEHLCWTSLCGPWVCRDGEMGPCLLDERQHHQLSIASCSARVVQLDNCDGTPHSVGRVF